MVKRTSFNNFLLTLSHYSPILLTLLIIILFIKQDRKTIFFLMIIIALSYLFEKYEKHHVIPIVSFYLFNVLQTWLGTIFELLPDLIPDLIPDTIPIIGVL